jgi:hypothetical protein
MEAENWRLNDDKRQNLPISGGKVWLLMEVYHSLALISEETIEMELHLLTG